MFVHIVSINKKNTEIDGKSGEKHKEIQKIQIVCPEFKK